MLQITSNNVHIGTVEVAKAFKFETGLVNTSSEIISITNVQPSCGSCTAALVANAQILPGNTEALKVTFTPNSTSFSTSKSVNITYQQGGVTQPKITFTFTAKVI